MSLPLPGAWIEIRLAEKALPVRQRSLPLPGAWIEIYKQLLALLKKKGSLPLPGAWIEISENRENIRPDARRSLYRERGLKSER